MDLDLTDKVVMITGSGSGIGQNMAAAFAAEGAKVAVNDVSKKGIDETLAMIDAAGGEQGDAVAGGGGEGEVVEDDEDADAGGGECAQ